MHEIKLKKVKIPSKVKVFDLNFDVKNEIRTGHIM